MENLEQKNSLSKVKNIVEWAKSQNGERWKEVIQTKEEGKILK